MRKIKIPTQEERHIESLMDDNAELMMRSAFQEDMLTSLQEMNAELLLRLAILEDGGVK